MNATSPTPAAPRRRIWFWVLGLCLAPFMLLGLAAASYVTLDRDAVTLRKHVMAATNSEWDTRVQVSVGRLTLGAVRSCLWFVHDKNVADARLALKAVRHASVGVYEREGAAGPWSREELFVQTDRAMQKRGWSRLVGVADDGDTVLVYVPDAFDQDGPVDVCVAVVSKKELVVVSTTIDPEALGRLIEKKAGEDIKRSLRTARL